MLPHITALDQIPLGPRIEQSVGRFGGEEFERIKILRYVMSMGYEPLYPSECRKEYGWIKGWEDVRSATILREKYMAVYVVLKYMRDKLRGKVPNIVLPGMEIGADNLILCQSEWLANKDIRTALHWQLEALWVGLRWFNIKTLANWIDKLNEHQLESFHLTRDLPVCELSGKVYDIRKQCAMLDDFTYMMGRHETSSLCGRSYQLLMGTLEASEPLKALLAFDQEDMDIWALARTSGKLIERREEQAAKPKEPEPPPDPHYTKTPGGIFVPTN